MVFFKKYSYYYKECKQRPSNENRCLFTLYNYSACLLFICSINLSNCLSSLFFANWIIRSLEFTGRHTSSLSHIIIKPSPNGLTKLETVWSSDKKACLSAWEYSESPIILFGFDIHIRLMPLALLCSGSGRWISCWSILMSGYGWIQLTGSPFLRMAVCCSNSRMAQNWLYRITVLVLTNNSQKN